MKKKGFDQKTNSIEGYQTLSQKSKSPRKKNRLVNSPYEVNNKILTYQQNLGFYSGLKADLKKDYSEDDDSDEEDSMFGSFNPNLNTKDGEGSYQNKQNSLPRGSSFETISKFTNKTGSFMGLLHLEKVPDEVLL